MQRLFAKMLYLLQKNIPTVLVTVVSSQGSAPRGTGSQMLVGEEGRIIGTIGGGAVEKLSTELAQELVKKQENCLRSFALNQSAQDNIGMVCGGDVTVWFQYVPGDSEDWRTLAGRVFEHITLRLPGYLCIPTDGRIPSVSDYADSFGCCLPLPIGERVLLFGAGHCAQALAPLLHRLGFRVYVYDDREEYCNRDHFFQAEEFFVAPFTEVKTWVGLYPDDYAVVMTSGHAWDLEVQDQLLRQPMAYIGVIGSKKKKAAVNQKLRERGISQEMIDTVHSPIGLDIGAVTPEEIAVSIAAEMIQVRADRRKAAGTYEKSCPMH